MILEGLAQFGRPQQTADVIGPKGRSAGGAGEHRFLPSNEIL
jgi:hypothetical protein